jgi:sigma-B regulation protein RsbU (phosphoserine phosphatase)
VPLQLKGTTIGVIYVDNRLQAGLFTTADLDLLTAIASSAAVAIENARLYQVAVEKGRMERELSVAREVQASLLPRQTPYLDGWEFAAVWQPAREVAGDFYDFISVDLNLAKAQATEGRTPLQGWGVVIADVSDKGMPAALFMALSRSIVRASVANAPLPSEGIAHANRLICADATNGMFVTLFFAQFSPEMDEVVYVNAGHNPPLLYRADKNELTELTRTGMALGIVEGARYDQHSVQLNAGDFILLYTDGVTDALNAEGHEFGMESLRRVVLDHRNAPAAELVKALDQALSSFSGASAPFDDITILVAKHL